MELSIIYYYIILLYCILKQSTSIKIINQECQSINNIFKSKGFTYPWWNINNNNEDQQQQQHHHHQSQSSNSCHEERRQQQQTQQTQHQQPKNDKLNKCCSQFDTRIQKNEMKTIFLTKWLNPKLNLNSNIFKEKKSNFDDKFKIMLTNAHTSFHSMFEKTYGMLYIQHAHVFHALFTTLEKYYNDGHDSLELKLIDFFTILTRKMFEVLNAQYEFDEAYLSCATIIINDKQGNELHKQIVSSLRRSFVATRALSQGLLIGDKIINNLNKIHINDTECIIQLSKMLNCPICLEQRSYKPCQPLCIGIITKCLSSTNTLNKPWLEYILSLENIIDRLLGPYNIEAVVEPIHIKISEIIMNFQENGHDLSQNVFSKCGKPKLRSRITRSISISKREAISLKTKTNHQGGGKKQQQQNQQQQQQDNIEKLLREIKNKIKKTKTLFELLPRQICNIINKDYSSQLCWNGTGIIKPEKKNIDEIIVVSNSDVKMINNKDPIINEQILILSIITDKLKNAFNGLDVQWVNEIDGDDFGGSGSGSGDSSLSSDTENDEDDEPDGQIHHNDFKFNQHNNITTKILSPHIFHPTQSVDNNNNNKAKDKDKDNDDDDDDDDDADDDADDGLLNLNLNSNENNGGIRNIIGGGNSGSSSGTNNNNNNNNNSEEKSNNGIDFGIPPQQHEPPQPPSLPPIIKIKSTTNKPIETRPTIVTTTTSGKKIETVSSSNNKLGTAGKAIAIIKLFTPVFMSMLGKIFPF